MSKLSMLAAGSIGFLLGSRSGRQPYEKAVAQAQRVRANPKVQDGVDQAKRAASEKASEATAAVRDKAADLGSGSAGEAPAGYGDAAAPQGGIR